MNKRHLPCFAGNLIVPMMLSSVVMTSEDSNQKNAFKYLNVTAIEACKLFIIKESLISHELFILDVRSTAEYSYTHIKGAKLIPLKNMPLHDPINLPNEELLEWHINNNANLPENKCTKILVYCMSGKRGAIASQMLIDAGYKRIYNMQGGIAEWVNAGYPIVVNYNLWAANYPKLL